MAKAKASNRHLCRLHQTFVDSALREYSASLVPVSYQIDIKRAAMGEAGSF